MKYIVSVDQSTSSSKAFLIDENGYIVKRASKAHEQFYPKDGYVEHDAEEIFSNVEYILNEVTEGVDLNDIKALSIANQRETTVLWEKDTGKCPCRAIVWQDVRGKAVCEKLAAYNQNVLETTGMALSPYYSAGKVAQVFIERPDIKERAAKGEILMGTIESYLIYRLTGNHYSDYSNASRTQLLNLRGLKWDEGLIKLFGLYPSMLPELKATDDIFGCWKNIPITGVLGDSHATLFGQGCVTPGSVKVSYGTGSSVMMNIGSVPAISGGGLTTAIAFNYQGKVHYQTEGNITCSCDTLVWLCRELGLYKDANEIETLANSVPDPMGVCLVPAFSGLGAPYFDVDARAVICNLSRGTTKAHVARAALEGIANRIADVTEAMASGSTSKPKILIADGGGARNALLMQLQADLADCEVRCSAASELSALGAAYMAGIKVGVYSSLDDIPARKAEMQCYTPKISSESRKKARGNWLEAVKKAKRA